MKNFFSTKQSLKRSSGDVKRGFDNAAKSYCQKANFFRSKSEKDTKTYKNDQILCFFLKK